MSNVPLKWLSVAGLVLASHAPVVSAQMTTGAAERLHANALASFRAARFPEAYGRVRSLADAGHVPSARLALWMYVNGPTVFGNDWDSSPEQLEAWAKLAGQATPAMLGRSYPPSVTSVAGRERGSKP